MKIALGGYNKNEEPNFLYTKNLHDELHLVHKITGAVKIIKKEGVYYGK